MSDAPAEKPPLFAVRGDATPEEVAAIVAVLQGLSAGAASSRPRPPRPEWSSPARAVRRTLRHGTGGWRSSTLPG